MNRVEAQLLAPPATLAVRPYAPADRERWEAFVLACPEATFFHRIGWREIFAEVFRHRAHYLLAERDGAIVGVLPLVELRSLLFGHSLQSLPFAVYGGVAALDDAARAALVRAADELGARLGVSHLELRHRAVVRADWPRSELHVTFRKAIAPEVEANLLAIPRKQRAVVRKALQRGLRSEIDPGVDRFFALYADNMHRHGTPPQPRRYFEALRRVFGDDCEVLLALSPEGEPVAGVMSFYFRDEVLPYYAGDLPQARDLGANDFKYWELMRRACERGVKVFD